MEQSNMLPAFNFSLRTQCQSWSILGTLFVGQKNFWTVFSPALHKHTCIMRNTLNTLLNERKREKTLSCHERRVRRMLSGLDHRSSLFPMRRFSDSTSESLPRLLLCSNILYQLYTSNRVKRVRRVRGGLLHLFYNSRERSTFWREHPSLRRAARIQRGKYTI